MADNFSAVNTKKREGFNQMVRDALDGKIDLIVTKSVSRFARDRAGGSGNRPLDLQPIPQRKDNRLHCKPSHQGRDTHPRRQEKVGGKHGGEYSEK